MYDDPLGKTHPVSPRNLEGWRAETLRRKTTWEVGEGLDGTRPDVSYLNWNFLVAMLVFLKKKKAILWVMIIIWVMIIVDFLYFRIITMIGIYKHEW